MKKKHKLTKRLLTSVLSLTMVFTSVNLPPLTTTVHAATVTSATELTSLHAGATLSSGMYYVSSNLTFNADKSKYNGLKIAENSTVYITVPAGVTLTVYGGAGTNATSGKNAKAGTVGGAQIDDAASKYFKCSEVSAPTAGTAGTSSTGGGAAIYVPSSATLILLGEGTINAIGGTGGTAANGTSGSISQWNFSTVKIENRSITQYYYLNSNTNVANTIPSPSTTHTGKTAAWNGSGYAGAGGAGGAGASGGGAGIGSNGANGNAGIAGGINAGTWNDGESYAVVSGPTNNVIPVISCGTIKTDGKITISATGGNGGSEGNIGSGADLNKKSASFTYYKKEGTGGTAYSTNTATMNWYNGQPGAGGGAGGKGASIGTGGQGGAGGQGGSSGSVEFSLYGSPDVPSAATKGANGSNGTAKTPTVISADSELPQYTVTYMDTNGTTVKSTQTYYVSKTPSLTAPAYTGLTGTQTFNGWEVVTPAINMGDATSELLTRGTSINANATISTSGICGNVVLKANVTNHRHNWNYEQSGNVVKAYCAETTYTSECSNNGEANAVRLTLSASNTVYTGSAYNKASVDNKITAVTKANAGSINYVGIDGTTYDSSTTAPTNVGKYQASVTIGGKTATKDFEITKKQVTKPAENTNSFTYNKLQQKYLLTENTDYQITNDTRTNAGTQTVTVALKDKTNTCWADNTDADLTFTFTIKPADQTGITVGTANYEFGETVSTPSKTAGTIEENATVTYYYNTENSNQGGTEWSNLANDTLDPGTYYVYAVYAATNNYNAFTTPTSSFEVTGKTIQSSEVTCNHVTETYDGTGYGINVTTTIPNPTIKYGETVNTCTLDESPLKVNASDSAYTIYYEVSARGYYTYKGSQTVKINRADVTVTPNAGQYMVYGDTEPTLKYTAPDLIGDDTLSGTLDRAAGETKGTYAYNLGTLANSNYNISLATDAPTFEIKARPVELNWSNTDLTYNGYNQSVTATVSNKVGNDNINLNYSNNEKTEVGNYTAEVTELGNPNYTLEGATGVENNWSISYLVAADAVVSGDKKIEDSGWYTGVVSITPVDSSFTISADGKADWADELATSENGTNSVTYYLKDANGFITDKKTATFKIDTTVPEGTITIKNNSFTEFLNSITFGYFFKNTVDVNITANDPKAVGVDEVSGVKSIEYQKVNKGEAYNADGTWTKGSSLSVTANAKFTVYARITDKAGNVTIISSEGNVVYTDATASDSVTFTKTGTENVTTNIAIGVNTIKSIVITDVSTTADAKDLSKEGFELVDGKIVLKAAYLNTLLAGDYKITVSYNPYGETFINGQDATDSIINLTVKKAEGEVSITNDISKTYDKNAVSAPTYKIKGEGTVTVEYKAKEANDTTYTTEAPVNAGEYTVRVKVATDDNYKEATATKDFTISKADASITVSKESYEKIYGDEVFAIEGVENVGTSPVTYTSNDTDVATVDDKGKVTIAGAGEITITLAMEESDNFNATTKTVSVKVNPKAITVTAEDKVKTYADKDAPLTYKVNEKGLVGDEKLSDITLERETGEDAGTYKITASQPKNANSNYDITFVDGTYTINPMNIKDAVVVFGDKLVANGKEQTQKVESVKVGELDVTYDVTGNQATKAGTYTMKITGSKNFTGTMEVTYVVLPADENGEIKVDDIGDIKVEVKNDGKAPNTVVVTSKNDLVTMLADANELSKVAEGDRLDIWLEVKDANNTISEESKKAIISNIGDYKVGQYIDLGLFKQLVSENEATQVTKADEPIKISVAVPKELLNTNPDIIRTFAIVRNHEGKVDILSTVFDEATNSLVFETDQFSDYAIIYKDKAVEKNNDKDGNKLNTGSPKTGDTSSPIAWLSVMLIALAGMLLTLRKRKMMK